MITREISEKLSDLRAILKSMESVLVAFSGGVDSSLLLKVASMEITRLLAVTADSETYSQSEAHAAAALARELGIDHLRVPSTEMANPAFRANTPQRCYYCKRELFSLMLAIAQEKGLLTVVEGSNADDTGDYRPGITAAREMGIRSPLIEASLHKSEIRQLAQHLGLPNWNKPAMPCLSSRIPYGQAIMPDSLRQVEQAEGYLLSLGLTGVRVRHHGHTARIEIDPDCFQSLMEPQVRDQVIRSFHELGFLYVTLDLEGFRSGSMNLPLTERTCERRP